MQHDPLFTLSVDSAEGGKVPGGRGELTIVLSDKNLHGIVNGGHTFCAIRENIETASEMDAEIIEQAFVRLHVLSGIAEDKVPEIAEGLNRSKQVDDPSLVNLQGHFERIREVMKGRPGENEISYHQGDNDGGIYVTEILAMLEMFNCERFTKHKHPHNLLNRLKSALEFYKTDLKPPSPLDLLVPRLPEILTLADNIRKKTPEAAKKHANFELGRMKLGKERAGSATNKNEPLPFIGETVDCRVPNGWLFPTLAAFRANVRWDLGKGLFAWKVPLDELLDAVIADLVRVCVSAHRDDRLRPDQVGKRETTYGSCYDKVSLYLLERETR